MHTCVLMTVVMVWNGYADFIWLRGFKELPLLSLFLIPFVVLLVGIPIYLKIKISQLCWLEISRISTRIQFKNRVLSIMNAIPQRINKCFGRLPYLMKHLSKGLMVLYTMLLMAVPLSSSSTASIEDDLNSSSSMLSKLTASDLSVGALAWAFGSVIYDIQAAPLSLNFLTGKGPVKDPVINGELNTDYIENLRPISEIKDLKDTSVDPAPDSAFGFASWVSGFILVSLMSIAAAYKIFFTYTADMLAMKADESLMQQAIKKMLMVGGSAGMAFALATPLYKGYSLLALMLFSFVVTGIGGANAFSMLYFNWQSPGVAISNTANPKADPVFNTIMQFQLCNKATALSTGGDTSTEVVQNESIFGSEKLMDFSIDYSSCGTVDIKSSESTSPWFESSVMGMEAYDGEKEDLIAKYASDEYLKTLSELNSKASQISDDIMKLRAKHGDGFFEQCAQYNRSTTASEKISSVPIDIEGNTLDNEDKLQCMGGNESIASRMIDARIEFSAKINNIAREAFLMAEDQLKIVTKEDGTIGYERGDNSLKLDDLRTYGEYRLGWLQFPFYMAKANWAGNRTMDFLKVDISADYDDEWLTDQFLAADIAIMQIYYEYLKDISYSQTALYNSKKSSQDTDTLLDGSNIDVNTLSNIDGRVSTWLAEKIVFMFRTDGTKNVIAQYADAGQTMIALYIAYSAALGAFDGLSSFLGANPDIKDKLTDNSIIKTVSDLKDRVGSKSKGSGMLSKASKLASTATPWTMVGAGVGSAVGGALSGAYEAYEEILKPLFRKLIPFAILLAYVMPALLALQFFLCALKWVMQVLKMAIFSVLAVLKVFTSDGNELFGSSSKDIFLGHAAVALMPIFIVTLFITCYSLATPLVSIWQLIAYKTFPLLFADTLQGPLYIIFMVTMFVLPPCYAIFYLMAIPSTAMDSMMQFMSLNLGIQSPSQGVSGFNAAMGVVPKKPDEKSSNNSSGGGSAPSSSSPNQSSQASSKGGGSKNTTSSSTTATAGLNGQAGASGRDGVDGSNGSGSGIAVGRNVV